MRTVLDVCDEQSAGIFTFVTDLYPIVSCHQ